jgi:hypothetical protein
MPSRRARGLLLALADDLEERCPRGGVPRLAVKRGRDSVTLRVPDLIAWRSRGLAKRFARRFDRRLLVRNSRQTFSEG